jgi:hypothetical protein
MQLLHRNVAFLLLAAALVACESDKPTKDQDATADDEPAQEDEPDADMTTSRESDAGTPQPSGPVPLTVWVDDLIEHRTSDDAEPDTVDDKVISDDTDEMSFDKYLP